MKNTPLFFFLLFFSILLTTGCSQQSQHSANNRVNQNHPIVSPQTYRPQTKQSPRIDKQGLTRNRMVKIATSTIGAPYKWGGSNPTQGFDCSGLMSYVHKNALGLNIPRTAAKQRDHSRTITYAQLKPGDMLFFKTGKKSNHVGIYIGNREFVHAATGSKHVKVATMDSKYWFKRFVKFGTFL